MMDGLCPLCAVEDTKQHRVYECPALSEARVGYEDVLSNVQNSILMGRTFFMRLSTRTIPCCVSWHNLASCLRCFLGLWMPQGSAFSRTGRHTTLPALLLGSPTGLSSWPCTTRTPGLLRVGIALTRGSRRLPSEFCAKAAKLLRGLNSQPWRWARQCGATVNLYTDSQYVVDIWRQVQTTRSLLTVATNRDLAADLLHAPFLECHQGQGPQRTSGKSLRRLFL